MGIIGAFANGTLPQLYAASNQLAKGSGSTTVWAVGALGFAVKAVVTPNSNSYSNSPFAPALTFTLVTGLGSKALYGITWCASTLPYGARAGVAHPRLAAAACASQGQRQRRLRVGRGRHLRHQQRRLGARAADPGREGHAPQSAVE